MILAICSTCSTDKYAPTIRFPYLWLSEPGYGGDIDQQEFCEPSGICFYPIRKTLFVVSDEGYLYIAQDRGGILKVKDLR